MLLQKATEKYVVTLKNGTIRKTIYEVVKPFVETHSYLAKIKYTCISIIIMLWYSQ